MEDKLLAQQRELQEAMDRLAEEFVRSETITWILIVLNLLNLFIFPLMMIWMSRRIWLFIDGALMP